MKQPKFEKKINFNLVRASLIFTKLNTSLRISKCMVTLKTLIFTNAISIKLNKNDFYITIMKKQKKSTKMY